MEQVARAAQGRGLGRCRVTVRSSSSNRTIVALPIPVEPPGRVFTSDKNTDPRSTD
ncbi:hypothetical protein [Burkholderia latens]|uniref:hypothetical protein n=1 Tax=Burkholderia latens TaxID=488446 RepID=UPI001479435F|nr:hypothetical protein [Burkholderia latens]